MAINFIIVLIFDIFVIGILINVERSFLNDYRENRNKINLALVFLLITFQLSSIYSLITLYVIEVKITIGNLDLIQLFALVSITIQFNFLLYIKKLKKFLTLPVISSFYIAAFIVVEINPLVFLIYASISGVVALILFVSQGLKNRNGMIFTLGIFLFMYGLSAISEIMILNGLIRIVASIILALGTSGFVDRYILIDKEKKLKVQNVWISRMVIEEGSR